MFSITLHYLLEGDLRVEIVWSSFSRHSMPVHQTLFLSECLTTFEVRTASYPLEDDGNDVVGSFRFLVTSFPVHDLASML